ncbi:4-demethylwyosine synthase TYW1 [Candidatus Pacearchaeota archaeon]|nr:4-demethylwyosine synthase TYW1 [Candidatus Pacearchaeota archaeon]
MKSKKENKSTELIPIKLQEQFKKQHYGLVGKHSAVQICMWTKRSLKDEGSCYKQQFYGIKSHRCCQMSPSISWCQHRCLFCWRAIENTLGEKMPINNLDDPKTIIEGCIREQRKLLAGFGGNEKVNKKRFQEAQEPMHFAISLAGEPTLYPKISDLIKELKKIGKTSFLVTNGECPDILAKICPPTQLYVSLDAPNEKVYKIINQPQIKNGWKNLMKTLDIVKKLKKKTRTVLRLTLVKNINMIGEVDYAKLVKKADPMFVEIKAYMAVGFSRNRLGLNFMPLHEEVREFANKIGKLCKYKIIDEKKDSRVVLLMKRDTKKRIMKF